MKALLTGHKGFIGSHYLPVLKEDYDVTCADKRDGVNLCDPNIEYYNLGEQDVVIHLAATNGTKLFYKFPTEVTFNNTLPTFNLVKQYSNSKFVFASTCEIFNGAIDKGYYKIPTDEKVPIHFENILNPRWSYSLPKALGENLVANACKEWLIIRYFNVYGPGQKDHFLSEFITRASKGIYHIKGDETRSFCYIDDAIAMTHELVKNHSGHIVNIGNSQEIKISAVARMIMDIMGIDPNLLEIFNGPKGSVKRRCPDTTLVKKLTGFNKYTPLAVGLRNTIDNIL